MHGSDEQLEFVNPVRVDEIETGDVRIVLEGYWNTKALTGVDPARQARFSRAREQLRNRYLERAADGDLRWVLTAYPTNAAAQDAEMSLAEYEDFVYGAGLLDADDPVAAWEAFARADRARRRTSSRTSRSCGSSPTGPTSRSASPAGTGSPRRASENFPDGEVFTGADRGPASTGRSTSRTRRSSRAARCDDVRLRFEGGEVVEATARARTGLPRADDRHGRRRAPRSASSRSASTTASTIFTRNILFDEKIGGTVHLALGTAYPESGGLNRSGLHWDMICDLRTGSEVYADGELVYRDGQFLPDLF